MLPRDCTLSPGGTSLCDKKKRLGAEGSTIWRRKYRAADEVIAATGVSGVPTRLRKRFTIPRMAEAIYAKFADAAPLAHAHNAGLVVVAIPPQFASRATEFMAELENVSVDADRPARVIINERTGAIVLGKDVRISPAAILHGNLS